MSLETTGSQTFVFWNSPTTRPARSSQPAQPYQAASQPRAAKLGSPGKPGQPTPQEEECARILALQPNAPPLSVLGLGGVNFPSDDDVRKRYKELAMLLHPDKCSLPRSEEAFKRVNEAYRGRSRPLR